MTTRKKKYAVGGALLGAKLGIAAPFTRGGRKMLGRMVGGRAKTKGVFAGTTRRAAAAKFILRHTGKGRRKVVGAMGALGRGRMYGRIAKASLFKAVKSGGLRGALRFLRG